MSSHDQTMEAQLVGSACSVQWAVALLEMQEGHIKVGQILLDCKGDDQI